MKKFLALAAALACVLAVPRDSRANSRWVWDLVPIHHLANNAVGFADSATFSHSTAVWGAATLAVGGVDTTGPIRISDLAFPPVVPTVSAVDTATWAIISIRPQNSSTVSALDTVYVSMQVSMDGVNWVGASTNAQNLGAGEGLFTALGAQTAAVLLEDGTSDGFRGRLKVQYGNQAGAFATTAPGGNLNIFQAFGWVFMRFAIYTDGSTTGHSVYLGHWADVVTTNPATTGP